MQIVTAFVALQRTRGPWALLSPIVAVFAQIIFGTSQRGVGSLYRRIPSSEVGLWVRHKYMAGEMVHETYTNKHSWASAGSTRRAEVWSVARAFEVKPVCKEPLVYALPGNVSTDVLLQG